MGRQAQPDDNDGKVIDVGLAGENQAIFMEKWLQSAKRSLNPGRPLLRPEPDFRISLGVTVSRSRLPQTVQSISGALASLAWAVHWSGFPVPAIVRPDPSRMPCRSHCVQPRQAGGIRRHVAEIHLASRRAPLSAGHIPPFLRSLFTNCIKSEMYAWLNFSRGLALVVEFFGRMTGAFSRAALQ